MPGGTWSTLRPDGRPFLFNTRTGGRRGRHVYDYVISTTLYLDRWIEAHRWLCACRPPSAAVQMHAEEKAFDRSREKSQKCRIHLTHHRNGGNTMAAPYSVHRFHDGQRYCSILLLKSGLFRQVKSSVVLCSILEEVVNSPRLTHLFTKNK